MSPPHDPRAQCHGKVAWPSKGAALEHRRRLLERRRDRHACHKDKTPGATALHAYKCATCHQWHLGNPSNGKVAK